MTRVVLSAVLVAVLFAGAPIGAAHHEAGEATMDGFTADLIGNIKSTEKKLVALAEAMPADMYGWAPSVEVRTYSETLIHVAGANFFIPMALGAPPLEGMPADENPMAVMQKMEAEITAKDDVIAKMKKSFAYLYDAIPTITDLDEKVELFGPPSSKRSYLFILQGHAHEHLGQAIAYARSVGVVPPWSQPAPEDADANEEEGGEG
jgi:uncharacterized damage-inducible protein DinB